MVVSGHVSMKCGNFWLNNELSPAGTCAWLSSCVGRSYTCRTRSTRLAVSVTYWFRSGLRSGLRYDLM